MEEDSIEFNMLVEVEILKNLKNEQYMYQTVYPILRERY